MLNPQTAASGGFNGLPTARCRICLPTVMGIVRELGRVCPELRKAHNDERWASEIGAAKIDPRYADLQPLVKSGHIYYAENYWIDKIHAERMDCDLHPFPEEWHGVVKTLRDTGWLRKFLQGLERTKAPAVKQGL